MGFIVKLLGSSLFRYGGGALLVAALTWFGGGYVKDVVQKAKDHDTVVDSMEALKLTHATELETLKAAYEAKIEAEKDARLTAESNAEESNERREHWRQSWYKKNSEFENYKDATRAWVGDLYPAELDRLREQPRSDSNN